MAYILGYFDIYRNEIIEMAGTDELPVVGGTVTFTSGDNEGSWHICGIKQKPDDEMYDAYVFLDDRE